MDQSAGLEAQIAELEGCGCTRVFAEMISSVDARRPQLAAALEYLREGDTFCVTRPDRLARSARELLSIVESLHERGVRVRILSMDVDTATPTGKLLLTLMAGIAQAEREIMLERQRCGIAAARRAGKYKGRKPTARARGAEVLALRAEGVGVAEIVRRTGVSRASVYRILDPANDQQAHR